MKITLVVGALLLVVACGDSAAESERPPLSLWAAQVCEAAETMSRQLDSVDDGIDPTTLSLEARIARSERIGAESAAALEAAADTLRSITPAEGTDAFHDALISEVTSLAETLRQQDASTAQSHADIEAMNAEINIESNRMAQAVQDAAAPMPEDAALALLGITRCGTLT